MRIAFISSMEGGPWGGSESLWAAAAGEALASGHGVAISVLERAALPPRILELQRAGAGVIPRPRRSPRLVEVAVRPSWLRRLSRFDPGVLCVSQGNAYECAGRRSLRPLFRWLRRGRVPLVTVAQFNAPDIRLRPAVAARARWLQDRAAANLFVAARNVADAERHLGRPVPRVRLVCNPVNLADTSALPWPGDSVASFACVARLHAPTKGQDLLLRAFGVEVWRSRSWRLSLFGEGPDRPAFERLATDLGLDERVAFHGHVEDIRTVWREHHMLLLPSRSEGMPLALIEAMVLGRPCLVTDVGGCTELITEPRTGFVALHAELEDIMAALERAWRMRAEWPDVGARARAEAVCRLDPAPGRTMLDILCDAAARPSRA